MLPYRRRPPAFASKQLRAQQEELESSEERYACGGPIQRAMEKDLMELRPKFLQLIETLSGNSQQHVSAGDAFQSFKQVFGHAKVALVHTRTLPPRSDRGAYVQLLYSACLSLLKRAFQTETVVWEHAIYAVFCLYALYETNPLLAEPQSPLQMLTVGLQHPDNPKFLYRRSFKSPIRIDWYTSSFFQRLYDEALARQSDCQCTRMKEVCGANYSGASDDDEPLDWNCTCGLFMDVVQVVDRLMPNFDLTERTGPSGLEALVGHADYPWGCERPKKTNKKETVINVSQSNDARFSNDELDAIAEPEQAFDPLETNLDGELQQYQSSLRQVRLASLTMSASNQAARVRDALKPIFEQSTETTRTDAGIGNAQSNVSNEQPPKSASEDDTTNVPAQSVSPAAQSEAVLTFLRDDGNTADTIDVDVDVERKNALKDLNYKLVLPSDLPETLRNVIEAALNEAIESGDIKIERNTESMNESNSISSVASQRGPLDGETFDARERETDTRGVMFGSNFLATGTSKEAGAIDQESDSSDLLSIASEDSNEVGKMTLHTLLTAAGESDIMKSIRMKRKRKKRGRQSSSAVIAAERKSRVPVGEDALSGSSSDESSSSEENVGRASLHALLSAVRNKDTGERIRSQQEQSLSSRTILQQAPKPRGKKKCLPPNDEQSESSEESDSDIDHDHGRASLHALLSAINDNNGQDKRPHKAPKKRKTVPPGKQGYRGNKRPRKPAILSSDPQSKSAEESMESESVGPLSLETLLAAVNIDEGVHSHQNTADAGVTYQAFSSVNRSQIKKQHRKASQREDSLSRTSSHRETGSIMSLEDHKSEHVGSSDDDSLQNSSQQGQAALGALLSLVSNGNDTG